MQSIDELAREITALPRSAQEALLDNVAQINLQRGLKDLAEKYKKRLAHEGRLDIPADRVWAELQRIREEAARSGYPN